MRGQKTKRFVRNLAVCGVISVTVTGCAETIIAGLTISELLTAGSIVSAVVSGKGLGEHALDVVTGQDCRILEAIFRSDRAVCEPKDSIATQDDFKGLIALLDTPAGEQIQLADIPMGKDQFPAINEKAVQKSPKLLAALTHKNLIPSTAVRADEKIRMVHLTAATSQYEGPRNKDFKRGPVAAVDGKDLRKRLTRDLF